MASNDDFVLTDTFYSGPGPTNQPDATHAQMLRKSVNIPHSISNTSLNQSLKSSSSAASSIQKTSAMKSSPSMKALETILHQKSVPSSASTSAAASIPEERDEDLEDAAVAAAAAAAASSSSASSASSAHNDKHSQASSRPDDDDDYEEEKKPTSVFSLQSARESTNSVQTFHSSKSHGSGSTNAQSNVNNRFSLLTIDGDKTPVLQMSGSFEGGATTPAAREAHGDEDDDDNANETTIIEGGRGLDQAPFINNIVTTTVQQHANELASQQSPVTTATTASSSSSLLPPPSIPALASPVRGTHKIGPAPAISADGPVSNHSADDDEDTAAVAPAAAPAAPAGAGAAHTDTFALAPAPVMLPPTKSMIPEYIPRIQPPSKRNTPSSSHTHTSSTSATNTTPKQANSSTFDSPHTVTTRPSVQSTPRTPNSPYGRSNSSYSLNFKKISQTQQQQQQSNDPQNASEPAPKSFSHKRSSTLSDLSKIVDDAPASATATPQKGGSGSKKFSFKSLFKSKSKQHSLNEQAQSTSPSSSSTTTAPSPAAAAAPAASATAPAAPSATSRVRPQKKPRSFSSPNLTKLAEAPIFDSFTTQRNASAGTATTSNASASTSTASQSNKSTSPAASAFLNVFKRNRSSDNLKKLDGSSRSVSARTTPGSTATPQQKLDQDAANDNIATPASNGYLIREVNDDDYVGGTSSPPPGSSGNYDDSEDFGDGLSKGLSIKKARITTPRGATAAPAPDTTKGYPSLAPTAAAAAAQKTQPTSNTSADSDFVVPTSSSFAPNLASTPATTATESYTSTSDSYMPTTLAPPPTAPSIFNTVIDEPPSFGSPFEVKYSPKDSIEDFAASASTSISGAAAGGAPYASRSASLSKKDNQLLGEALFPKSLNAQEVESIVSLERSRSMRSFKSSSNKRNSFVNYDGSNENIIQGDSSLLSSPSLDHHQPVNRSTSILKNSDSRRNLQIDSIIEGAGGAAGVLKSKQLVGDDHHSDEYSFEAGAGNYDDFIEFQDFIDVENLDFSPQLSLNGSFNAEDEGLSQSSPVESHFEKPESAKVPAPVAAPPAVTAPPSKPELKVAVPVDEPVMEQPQQPQRLPPSPIDLDRDLPAIPKSARAAPRISLPKKTSKDSFTKVDSNVSGSSSSARNELPKLNTTLEPAASAASTEHAAAESIVTTPLTPNLESIEHVGQTSPVVSQVESLIDKAFSNTPELNADGKGVHNNRPISMSFRGLNGPSFQGKLALQNLRSSASHQSFNISFADSSDIGSSTGVVDSEFDDDDDDDDESGIGNGFGSDDEEADADSASVNDEDDDEDDDDEYISNNIPNFDPPPAIGKKKSNGSLKSDKSSASTPSSSNGATYTNKTYGYAAANAYGNGPVTQPYYAATGNASAASSPRSLSSLISRSWKKQQTIISPRVPPKPAHTIILPANSRNNVRFSSRIVLYDTYNGDEYNRHPDTATCNQLTPMLAQQIKEELNTFKSQMDIHEHSRCYTHFF